MKVGIILPHLGNTQLAYQTICHVNYLIGQQSKNTFALFYEDLVQPTITPLCSTFPISNIWDFNDGHLISTTINNTITMGNSTSTSRKFFYVWDLEWMRDNNRNFLYNIRAFNNPNIELITRSTSHALAVRNFSKKAMHSDES